MANLTVIEKLDGLASQKTHRFMQGLSNALPQQSIILAPALVRQAITIIKASSALQECSEYSLFTSITEVAQSGLSLDLHLGQCYLVPFSKIATVMYGYRGLIELARRSGEVNEIVGEIRYEKDKFHLQLGSDRKIEHIPFDGPESKRGEILGAYAIADMRMARPVFEYMTIEQIDKIKNAVIKRAKGRSTVWETENVGEMIRKTPIRRLAKRLPQSPALIPFIQASIRDEYRQQGIHQTIDVSPEIQQALIEEDVTPAPPQREARESGIKETKQKKATPDAPITKDQANKIYTLAADLALPSTDVTVVMRALGHAGKLEEFPASKFNDLAAGLQERAK